jgi:hydroxypyruvate isomerase
MTDAASTRLRFDANLKWLFTEVPFEKRFDAAAEAGFTGVEYASPYEYSFQALGKLLADAGLKQVLINTPAGGPESATRSGAACLPDEVPYFRDGVSRALEYAVELNSNVIQVMAGIVPAGVSRDRAFARYVTNIAWASEQAKGTGVQLVLETQNKKDAPGFFLESQAHAAAVIEAVGQDNVGLLFDFYHVQIDEGDVRSKLAQFLPVISHIQVADPPTRTEPGSGELNWPFLFDAIRTSDYDGWIGCEYRPENGTVEGLGWLKGLEGSQ